MPIRLQRWSPKSRMLAHCPPNYFPQRMHITNLNQCNHHFQSNAPQSWIPQTLSQHLEVDNMPSPASKVPPKTVQVQAPFQNMVNAQGKRSSANLMLLWYLGVDLAAAPTSKAPPKTVQVQAPFQNMVNAQGKRSSASLMQLRSKKEAT